MTQWDINQARETYNIEHWGDGFFDVNAKGHITTRPRNNAAHPGVDLYEIAHEIRDAGLNWPVLVRVTHILHDRIDQLCGAFTKAAEEEGYQGRHTAVYPIKVNQQRTVVQHILAHGGDRVGLEAGSKPELMVVLAHANANQGVIVCNGYKDREYIRLALIGQQLGHQVYIVVEKLSELDLVLAEANDMGVRPTLGIRVRLASIGKGKWQNTGGEKSKFGLSATQVLAVVDRLKQLDMLDILQLVHCHLGSQLANIRDIQTGMNEVARYYSELRRLGAPIHKVDVGGGLGVDYEGTRSRSSCSMNYSVQEYANDVVHALWDICVANKLPHPDIITESGRAMTAHHAVLITDVIDYESVVDTRNLSAPLPEDPLVLRDMWQTLQALSTRSTLEAYHDAVHWLAEAQAMYTHGILTLEQRAKIEQMYFAICQRVQATLQASTRAHREVLDELNEKMADKFFCNMSVFQSIPDSWAIDQIFPIVPLHRLDEAPTRRAMLQDLTCDSDGAVEAYVDRDTVETTLSVHEFRPGEPYLFGIFMVGAYQEILGDLHNLFGDTHSINLEFTADGYRLVEPEEGDTVQEVLRYVHYSPEELSRRYREKTQRANVSEAQKRDYLRELDAGLQGYTYLE